MAYYKNPIEAMRTPEDMTTPSGLPSISGTAVNTSNLSPTPSMNVVPAPVVPFPTMPPVVAGEQITAPVAPSAIGDLENAIATRMGAKGIQTKVQQAGSGVQQQLNDIGQQIAMHQARALQRQEQALSRPGATTESANIDANIAARTDAIETLKLTAIQQGLQGSLALAQQTAKSAAEEETATQTARIETLRQNIINNYDKFTADQKKRADASLLRLDENSAFVKDKKAEREQVYSTGLLAQKFGADSVTVQKIFNAPNREEAVLTAGRFLQDPKARLELQNLQYETDINRLKKEALEKENKGTLTVVNTVGDVLKNSKIGQTTKTNIGTILGVINAAEDMAKGSPTGKFGGISPVNTLLDVQVPFTSIGVIPFREALRSKEGTRNTAYINAINLKIQQWASGASLTRQQLEQVEKIVPSPSDTDTKVKEKLNNLVNIMQQQIRGSLTAEGVTYDPPKVDLFNPQETLADIFKQ